MKRKGQPCDGDVDHERKLKNSQEEQKTQKTYLIDRIVRKRYLGTGSKSLPFIEKRKGRDEPKTRGTALQASISAGTGVPPDLLHPTMCTSYRPIRVDRLLLKERRGIRNDLG